MTSLTKKTLPHKQKFFYSAD